MISKAMHSLLKRQLEKTFGDGGDFPAPWRDFIALVDKAYHESDMDRNMLERSLELSSLELLQANSEMRAIFDVLPDIFFRVDADDVILDCKTGKTDDLFLPRTELIGRRIDRIPLTAVAGQFRQALAQTRQSRSAVTFEYALVLQDGERFYEARVIPLLDNQTVVIIRNTTDRKRAEEVIRKSEKQYRLLTEKMSDIVWIADLNLRTLYISPSVYKTLGFRQEEKIPMAVEEQMTPESLALALNTLTNELAREAEGVADPDRTVNLVLEYFHRDGSTRWMDTTIGGLRDEQGRLVGLHGLSRDITDRKKAQEALKKSEERYRTIFESTATANVLIAEDSTIMMVNDKFAELSGYAKEEIEGKLCWMHFVHPDDLSMMNAYRLRRLTHPQTAPSSYEFRFISRSGSQKELLLTVATISGIREIIASVIDITELRLLENRLIQAQKMESVGRLAGGVAHDFNNMLSVIIGNTEMALSKLADDQAPYKNLQEVLQAGQRSAALTRQLLAFARKQAVRPKALDLNETIANMLKMLQRLIGENIRLRWQPAGQLWQVKIDPSQVDQLLANLTVNARDAIAATGAITIQTGNALCDDAYCLDRQECVPGEYVLLQVSDDGAGMSPDTLAHIFEPFFTTKKEGQGTGLGLATVYGIVKQNNGFIDVDSRPGRGTTFRIYLPRHIAAEGLPATHEPGNDLKGGTETILLVEDDESVLHLASEMLATLGYHVLTAGNAAEALRLVRESLPRLSLLMTDVIMPDMNGKELRERVLALRPDLRCLFMSGYTADVIAPQGILEEGIQFIEKPFSLRELSNAVRKALN